MSTHSDKGSERTEKPAESHFSSSDAGTAATRLQDQANSLRKEGSASDKAITTGASKPAPGSENSILPNTSIAHDGHSAKNTETAPKADESLRKGTAEVKGTDALPNLHIDGKPKDGKGVHLSDKQQEDSAVQRKEGPYQVASRLLGKDASEQEKKSLVTAMQGQYNQETNNKDPKMENLAVGHKLMTNSNAGQILDRIQDQSMRQKISDHLSAHGSGDSQSTPKPTDGQSRQATPKPADGQSGKVTPKPIDSHPEQVTPKPADGHPGQATPKPADGQSGEPAKPAEQIMGPLGTPMVLASGRPHVDNIIASVYDKPQPTSSGRPFNPNEMTVAIKPELAKQMGLHNGDVVEVSHNGKSANAVYTDAGPFVRGRSVDLSTAVGEKIGITVAGAGTGEVSIKKVGHEADYLSAPGARKKK